MTVRVTEEMPSRMFSDWAMFHDPAKSWLWSAEEISDGVLDRASVADFKQVFDRLAADAQTG